MLKKIALGVLAILIVILLMAAMKPNTFSVSRSATIAAPPEKIAALITDFHQWQSWSPWENLDPAMQRSFSGAASGKGAVYRWQGNKEVGSGRMEIVEAASPARTVIKLDFIEPFAASNLTEFSLKADGDHQGGTIATWTMTGPTLFVTRLMTVFVSMDALIGKDFERGLARLKKAAEGAPPAQ
ncbi:SRPBCC family protein [Massilia sp. PWRC2]|uniref:SRPBCC family protein n=1 Tax=Massilia sp. PWRC2 TaxID=2804626 RepID=UPI003CF98F5F